MPPKCTPPLTRAGRGQPRSHSHPSGGVLVLVWAPQGQVLQWLPRCTGGLCSVPATRWQLSLHPASPHLHIILLVQWSGGPGQSTRGGGAHSHVHGGEKRGALRRTPAPRGQWMPGGRPPGLSSCPSHRGLIMAWWVPRVLQCVALVISLFKMSPASKPSCFLEPAKARTLR